MSRHGISVFCLFFSFTVCNKNFDLTILIEHSPTFGKSEFGKLKAFARHLVDAFDVTEGGTQVAVVSYGAKPIIHVLLNSFTGPQLRSRIIKETIDGIDFQKDEDSVSPSAALAKTLDTVFADGNGARNGTNKVMGIGKKHRCCQRYHYNSLIIIIITIISMNIIIMTNYYLSITPHRCYQHLLS